MDYYKLLEVDKKASPEVIKKAYKALSLKYHPDKHPDKRDWAKQRMQELNEAYEVIADKGKRYAYDQRMTTYWNTWLNEGLIGVYRAWSKFA